MINTEPQQVQQFISLIRYSQSVPSRHGHVKFKALTACDCLGWTEPCSRHHRLISIFPFQQGWLSIIAGRCVYGSCQEHRRGWEGGTANLIILNAVLAIVPFVSGVGRSLRWIASRRPCDCSRLTGWLPYAPLRGWTRNGIIWGASGSLCSGELGRMSRPPKVSDLSGQELAVGKHILLHRTG